MIMCLVTQQSWMMGKLHVTDVTGEGQIRRLPDPRTAAGGEEVDPI